MPYTAASPDIPPCGGIAGLCPSCNTRRMVETAAYLVDHFFPQLPVRQWVLSLPKRLRYFLRHDRRTVTAVLNIFVRVIEQRPRERSPRNAVTRREGVALVVCVNALG